jgi:hypothetical protein
MGKKAKQKVQTKTRSRKTVSRASMPKAKKVSTAGGAGPATDRFVKDLLVRGETAGLTPGGKLPLEATHVIEKQNEDGTATVRRLRYKLF